MILRYILRGAISALMITMTISGQTPQSDEKKASGQKSESAAPAQEEKLLTADELKSMLDKKMKLFYLDVREPKEIEQLGGFPGYVNIPISQLEKRINEIPRDVFIVAG